MDFMERHPPRLRYRRKSQILATIDLIWRVCDLFYAAVSIFFPKYGQKTRDIPENQNVLSYNVVQVMDDRVYDFLLSPFLTLIYFLGFFLQLSSSIFLCKSCNGKSLPDDERAACHVWSRIAIVSILILCIRFFLPYVFLSIFYITYNVVRVLFILSGIYIVIRHAKEMEALMTHFGHSNPSLNYGRSRIESNTGSCSHNEETSSIRLEEANRNKNLSRSSSSVVGENNQFIRPRLHRAMLHVEKEQLDKALNELKVAQSYAPEDPSVVLMLKALEEIIRINTTFSKDYYKTLGVSRNLTLEDIKKAFRRKSLRHHPDKHYTEDEKVKKRETKLFQEIREAYDTLSDQDKRKEYDNSRHRDQEALDKYKKIFRNAYASYDSQFLSTTV